MRYGCKHLKVHIENECKKIQILDFFITDNEILVDIRIEFFKVKFIVDI